jgi:hypothetical protein
MLFVHNYYHKYSIITVVIAVLFMIPLAMIDTLMFQPLDGHILLNRILGQGYEIYRVRLPI